MTKILVVDDDRDIASNLGDILTECGYDADLAYDGASALALAREHRYDVALLDFKMPDTDGASLYAELKALQPAMVAILITAYAGNDGVQRALHAGTWRVLRKPVEVSQLLALVEQAAHQPVVMVVDDDRDFCLNMWEILRDEGFRVALAFDEATARESLEKQTCDLLLLDLMLGAADALPLLESIGQAQEIPVIVVTGHPEQAGERVADRVRGIEVKPLDVPKLIAKIRATISS